MGDGYMTKNAWSLVDSFFDEYDIVDHHIRSYNDFLDNKIQEIVDITEPITLDHGEYTIKTGDVEIVKPFIKEADGSKSIIEPAEARLRNLNYSAHMYLDMALVKGDSEDYEMEKVRNIIKKISPNEKIRFEEFSQIMKTFINS